MQSLAYAGTLASCARSTTADTSGNYLFSDVPLGDALVQVRDPSSSAIGQSSGTVNVDQTTIVNVALGGFGQILVQVNFARGVPAGGAVVASSNRKVLTDSNGQAVLQAPVGSDVVKALHPDWTNSLQLSPIGSTIKATSSGDLLVDAQDRWVTFDDGIDEDILLGGGRPPLTHLFAGQNAASPSLVSFDTVNGKPTLVQTWTNLSVPAGQTMTIMHAFVQQIRLSGAQASVDRLVQLPPELISNLSIADAATVRNFALPIDGQSAVTALPALTATVSGTGYEGDARTPVRGANITVQSAHPIFSRVWGMSPNIGFCPIGTVLQGLITTGGAIADAGKFGVQGSLNPINSIPLPDGVPMRLTAQIAQSCFSNSSGHPSTRFPSPVQTITPSVPRH
jgi:hypothetical protein